MAAVSCRCVRMNTRHVGEGRGLSPMYLAIVARATRCPSMASSDWMRGTPQSGFSEAIRRMSPRRSRRIAGRPARVFHRQSARNLARCHPTTVAGCTMTRHSRHRRHRSDTKTQSSRSRAASFGRFTDRCRTMIWWRRRAFSANSDALEHAKECNRDRAMDIDNRTASVPDALDTTRARTNAEHRPTNPSTRPRKVQLPSSQARFLSFGTLAPARRRVFSGKN